MIALVDPQLMITSTWTRADVWRAAAPPGARALRVGGFRSMADVEAMLRAVGHAAGVADTDARVARFDRDWRAAAKHADGHGRRVLIIAACGGMPYSYGRRTTPYDLLSHAGYKIVEDHETLRHLRPGEPYETIPQLVRAKRPESLIVLVNKRSPTCNAQLAGVGVPVIALDDDKFVHPGPDLIAALQQLEQAQHD
jgi:iron complex transport system substrate-binding protein